MIKYKDMFCAVKAGTYLFYLTGNFVLCFRSMAKEEQILDKDFFMWEYMSNVRL